MICKMKINVKEKFVVVEVRNTKNPDFKILVAGASDYSGTISFLFDPVEFGAQLKPKDDVELDFTLQVETRRMGNQYKEIVENKRLNAIKVLGAK